VTHANFVWYGGTTDVIDFNIFYWSLYYSPIILGRCGSIFNQCWRSLLN